MNRISIIGVGRLGLGLALLIEKAGFDVLGVDVNEQYVAALNDRSFRTKEPEYETLLRQSGRFRATTSLQEGLEHSDVIFVVVPTPNSGGERFYDHAILSNLLVSINNHRVSGKHIIIGCTVMPTYVDEIGRFLLRDCPQTTLSYNPEFIAQGAIIHGFTHPDIILIGTTSPDLSDTLKDIYNRIVETQPTYCVLTPLEAEIVKIGINGYVTTKLSYANMISDLCDTVGANKSSVLSAIGGDSRVGQKYFKPGYSFGGPCFPRDTIALKTCLDQKHIQSDLLAATTAYNREHIRFQAQQLLEQDLDTYVLDDVCYKAGSKIPIIEESAKLKIAQILARRGKRVIVRDEIQLVREVQKEYGKLFAYEVVGDQTSWR